MAKFVDRVRVEVRAGDGGNGAVAWRRESHTPRGGPAGGDGGNGGDVILVADDRLTTLLDLKYRQHHRAESGRPGQTKGMHGRAGQDLEVRVPVGTQVFFEGLAGGAGEAPPWRGDDADPEADALEIIYVVDDEVEAGEDLGSPLFDDDVRIARDRRPTLSMEVGQRIGDLDVPGDHLRVAQGGTGGRGNIHFRSSTNRSPHQFEQGTPGQALWLRLELKLLADVGIVGFPNVGKSTLIRRISRARPEVGAYPFTTLVPQLGVVELDAERRMIVADVPGLVRGASQGRGLGHQFLRHLERTRVLLHLLAPDPEDGREPLADLDAMEAELTNYGAMFEGRPRVVALNKMDSAEGQALHQDTKRALRARNIPLFPICAMTGEGVDALVEALWRRLQFQSQVP